MPSGDGPSPPPDDPVSVGPEPAAEDSAIPGCVSRAGGVRTHAESRRNFTDRKSERCTPCPAGVMTLGADGRASAAYRTHSLSLYGRQNKVKAKYVQGPAPTAPGASHRRHASDADAHRSLMTYPRCQRSAGRPLAGTRPPASNAGSSIEHSKNFWPEVKTCLTGAAERSRGLRRQRDSRGDPSPFTCLVPAPAMCAAGLTGVAASKNSKGQFCGNTQVCDPRHIPLPLLRRSMIWLRATKPMLPWTAGNLVVRNIEGNL